MQDEVMQSADPATVVQDYIDAMEARNLDQCVALYDERASLQFGPTKYTGHKALREWHQARFAANMRLVRVDSSRTNGDTVVIDGVITSDRLKVWRLKTLSGRATFRVHEGKIADVRFALAGQIWSMDPGGAMR